MSKKSSSEDELELFMRSINNEVEKEKSSTVKNEKNIVRDDIENVDDQETYYKYLEEHPTCMVNLPDEYDSEGELVASQKLKIEPLPPVDHSKIKYRSFEKRFFKPHEDVINMDSLVVERIRQNMELSIVGDNVPPPLVSFAYFDFDESLMDVIREHNYFTPTPIQAQAIPVALSGRDLIGIAQTGSGKTAAYLIPMMVHVINQSELEAGDGPIGLVLAPTRALCQQIEKEAKRFSAAYQLSVFSVYGGSNLHKQERILQSGVEILIATPGRLIDIVVKNKSSFNRVTYLVLDEADKMFDMGFAPQIKSILANIRPDRQCLLFCATLKPKIEKLCQTFLNDPIRIVVGKIGMANVNILQKVIVLKDYQGKLNWLHKNIHSIVKDGSILVFVSRKEECAKLGMYLHKHGLRAGFVHGDFLQTEQDDVMKKFKSGLIEILLATDLASRGLDILSIQTVINFDVAKDISTHVNRIGRTGRAGQSGQSYTLITENDINILPDLINNLKNSGQETPEELIKLAMKNEYFRKHSKEIIETGTVSDKNTSGLGYQASKTESTNVHKTTTTTKNPTTTTKLDAIKSKLAEGYKRFKKASNSVDDTKRQPM